MSAPYKDLAVFFTRNVSLENWLDSGLFEREKLIYERHLQAGNFKIIYWLTYGANDEAAAAKLKNDNQLHANIIIKQAPRFFCQNKILQLIYSFLLPLIHKKTLQRADILKTNQMDGSWAAVIAKCIYKKPLIIRTGYSLTTLEALPGRSSKLKLTLLKAVEWLAYKYCNAAQVTSPADKHYICEHYPITHNKVFVIPNYINTNLFKPIITTTKLNNHIIYIGRLEAEKNISHLISAITQTDFTLDIYGQGSLEKQLKAQVLNDNAKVNFKGLVNNNQLPEILNRYDYYILCSLSEGMPKTLLEAMACGLVCIGSNIAGISAIITHNKNGLLTENTQVEGLHATLAMLDKNKQINPTLALNAVNEINSIYSLNAVTKQELQLFNLLSHNLTTNE